jgi:hypothetical protein
MKKKITRRQVDAWLLPMRRTLQQMRTGEINSIDGHAVTRMHDGDKYERVEWCIAGVRGLLERVIPGCDTSALLLIEDRLIADEGMTEAEIDAALSFLRSIEKPLMRLHVEAVSSAVRTEMIAIELDAIRVAA